RAVVRVVALLVGLGAQALAHVLGAFQPLRIVLAGNGILRRDERRLVLRHDELAARLVADLLGFVIARLDHDGVAEIIDELFAGGLVGAVGRAHAAGQQEACAEEAEKAGSYPNISRHSHEHPSSRAGTPKTNAWR